MKYMGSKRSMLLNGLGDLLREVVPGKRRFYDAFCGGSSVSGFVAKNFHLPVVAGDLQEYAVALARAQIEQLETFDASSVEHAWFAAADLWLAARRLSDLPAMPLLGRSLRINRRAVEQGRVFCGELSRSFPIARAYGGYYYSPAQAIALDALRATLPNGNGAAALAALLDAASTCAAAPGHTAQPFATTDSGLPHLVKSWHRCVRRVAHASLLVVSGSVSKVRGMALRTDAMCLTEQMNEGDLVFLDPPYSEVQYSRFYHVLESVATGSVDEVSGVGRYPHLSLRPQSSFCLTSKSVDAFDHLMLAVAATGAQAIVTFPTGEASNGLSGLIVEELSRQYFSVNRRTVSTLFSTMGGDSTNRAARQKTTELVLHLVPK